MSEFSFLDRDWHISTKEGVEAFLDAVEEAERISHTIKRPKVECKEMSKKDMIKLLKDYNIPEKIEKSLMSLDMTKLMEDMDKENSMKDYNKDKQKINDMIDSMLSDGEPLTLTPNVYGEWRIEKFTTVRIGENEQRGKLVIPRCDIDFGSMTIIPSFENDEPEWKITIQE